MTIIAQYSFSPQCRTDKWLPTILNIVVAQVRMFVPITFRIDPMHKWRQFKYSFVYIQISPTSLILGNIFL